MRKLFRLIEVGVFETIVVNEVGEIMRIDHLRVLVGAAVAAGVAFGPSFAFAAACFGEVYQASKKVVKSNYDNGLMDRLRDQNGVARVAIVRAEWQALTARQKEALLLAVSCALGGGNYDLPEVNVVDINDARIFGRVRDGSPEILAGF
ncbi:MAG: hypothetical protein AAGG69_02160 [Pseudomonadota bacterium]